MTRGARIAYSAAELRFVEAHCSMNRTELHAAFVKKFGRSDVALDHIKCLCSRKGWTKRTRWTADEDAVLRELYPGTKTDKIAQKLNRSLTTTYQRARKLGLEKSKAYLASADACRLRRDANPGIPYRFKKGQVPANKGLRRPGWSAGRMRETQFKKGARSGKAARNYMPIGSTRIIDGYEYTKVDDVPNVPYTVNWKPTHLLRWTAANGKVPAGHCLKSLDSNRLNTDPANWVAIPRAMLPILSGIHGHGFDNAPAELRPTILAMARLQHAANQRDGLTAMQRTLNKRKAQQQPRWRGRVA